MMATEEDNEMPGIRALLRVMLGLSVFCCALASAQMPALQEGFSGRNILFWSPEQQRLGYPRMAEIFPTRTVKAQPQDAVMTFAASDRFLDAMPFTYSFEHAGKNHTVTGGADAFMRRLPTAGLIVVKDGAVLLERYGLGHTAEMPWVSFSVTKSVVSMLVGAAIKDGYITSIDDPITKYLPHLRGGAYARVSVGQLLQMSSGVKWNEEYTDSQSDVAVAPLGGMPLYRYMNALARDSEPGQTFNYNTGETNLVGALLRSAIGNNLSNYLTAKIWQPFGMESDANWLLDAEFGAEVGGCCISATLRDYARIGMFALSGGRLPNGQSVLPDGWMRASTQPSKAFAGYGYSWWLLAPEVFAAEGVFGQIIWVDQRHNLVIALHSAWPRAWGDDLEAELMGFIRAVTNAAVESADGA